MQIDYMLIVVASLAQFVLGAVWYSPLMFGKWWMEIMEVTHVPQEELKRIQKQMAPFYALQLVLTLFSTFALANLTIATPFSIYHVAFWIWLSFIVPTQISGVVWANTKKRFWAKQIFVMTTYQFVGLMLAAFILSM